MTTTQPLCNPSFQERLWGGTDWLIVYNWNVHLHAQQHITNRLESGDHGQTFLMSSFYKHPSRPALDGMHGDRFHLPCINPADIHRCSGIVEEEQMWCLVGGHRWVNSRCDHHPSPLDKALHNGAVNLYKTQTNLFVTFITSYCFNTCRMVASHFTYMVGMCTGDGNLDVKVVDVDLPKP